MASGNQSKPKVEMNARTPGIITVNGIRYACKKITLKKIDKVEHSDRIIFAPIDEEKVKADKEVVVNALLKHTNAKELLQELLKEVTPRVMKRLAQRVRDKKPIRKHYGCLGFKIGDAYMQLIE